MLMARFKFNPKSRVPWPKSFTHRWITQYDRDWNETGRQIKFDGEHLTGVLISGFCGGLLVWVLAVIARDRVLPSNDGSDDDRFCRSDNRIGCRVWR